MINLAQHKRKLPLLIVIMIVLTVVVAGITLALSYNKAYERQIQWLNEAALSNANFMSAIAEHELALHNQDFRHAFDKTLSQIKNAHQRLSDMSHDAGYIVAKKENNNLIYLLYHSHSSHNHKVHSDKLHFNYKDQSAEPFRRALAGQSGTLTGSDFDGQEVLYAYAPVPILDVAVVVTRNLKEFRHSFIKAGIIAALSGIVFIGFATVLMLRIGNPLVTSAEVSRNELQTMLNTIVDGVLTCDLEGTITGFNGAAERLFGYSEAEILHKNISVLIPLNHRARHEQYMNNYATKPFHGIAGINREVSGERKDGSRFPIDIAISENTLNGAQSFTAIIRDISERKHTEAELTKYRDHLEEQITQRTADLALANSKLSQLAREDSLTGIANRRVFEESLEQELRRAARGDKALSLLICDIDYFKNYNDSLGHLAGDECLKTVARLIDNNFNRAGEIVARYGGEEFAVILPAIEASSAYVIAKNLLEKLSALNLKHPSSKISTHVTMSIGVATSEPHTLCDREQLIQAADNALYKAKANGRNTVEAFSDFSEALIKKG